MQLLQVNNNSGNVRTINVLAYEGSGQAGQLETDEAYNRGLGIKHFLVDKGTQRQIEIVNECPHTKPYIAFFTVG